MNEIFRVLHNFSHICNSPSGFSTLFSLLFVWEKRHKVKIVANHTTKVEQKCLIRVEKVFSKQNRKFFVQEMRKKIAKMINGKFQSLDTFLNFKTTFVFRLLLIRREQDESTRANISWEFHRLSVLIFSDDTWYLMETVGKCLQDLSDDCRPLFTSLLFWVQKVAEEIWRDNLFRRKLHQTKFPTFNFSLPLEIYFKV